MAILDQLRDRRGVFTDLGDVADQARKATNGFHPGDAAKDASDGASDAAAQVAAATHDIAATAKDVVKDATDTTRERVESFGDILRDLAREWSRAGGEIRLDEKVDDIAQRLRAAMPAATFKGAVSRLERELPDTDKDRYDRAFERGRVRTRSIYVAGGLAAGIVAGLVGAMLLDPDRGPARRARVAKLRDDVATQVKQRSMDIAEKARAAAKERGIGQPKADAVDPAGVTTGRDMVPVMEVGTGPVTAPSSTILEPLPGNAGMAGGALGTADPGSAIDVTADRPVGATHG